MSASVKVGDIVTLRDVERLWRVVYVNEEHDFARLEPIGEAWVRTRVADLNDLNPHVEVESNRTPAEILTEFARGNKLWGDKQQKNQNQ